MASHLTHQILAEDAIGALDPEHPFLTRHHNHLVLGAQGPDMFYHNQRTSPYGIQYGVALHRSKFGKFVAALVEHAHRRGFGFESDYGAFVYGYATHALLDRSVHPFINYFAGWVDPDDPESARYKSMHPFFERIIDVFMLRRRRNTDANSFDFYSQIHCGREMPVPLLEGYRYALAACFRKPRQDPEVEQRLRNAYSDAMGYYRYSNHVTSAGLREGRARERIGEIGPRWLSILHPLWTDEEIDFLNEAHEPWCDPCDRELTTSASFQDLFEDAAADSKEVFHAVRRAWENRIPLFSEPGNTESGVGATREDGDHEGSASLESIVGNGNLSDRRPEGQSCTKRFSRPLPLLELMERTKQRIDAGERIGHDERPT